LFEVIFSFLFYGFLFISRILALTDPWPIDLTLFYSPDTVNIDSGETDPNQMLPTPLVWSEHCIDALAPYINEDLLQQLHLFNTIQLSMIDSPFIIHKIEYIYYLTYTNLPTLQTAPVMIYAFTSSLFYDGLCCMWYISPNSALMDYSTLNTLNYLLCNSNPSAYWDYLELIHSYPININLSTLNGTILKTETIPTTPFELVYHRWVTYDPYIENTLVTRKCVYEFSVVENPLRESSFIQCNF
jgi:hypothetical protein